MKGRRCSRKGRTRSWYYHLVQFAKASDRQGENIICLEVKHRMTLNSPALIGRIIYHRDNCDNPALLKNSDISKEIKCWLSYTKQQNLILLQDIILRGRKTQKISSNCWDLLIFQSLSICLSFQCYRFLETLSSSFD